MRSSHGNGSRMSVAEARERRARMIRFHGSLENAHERGGASLFCYQPTGREWNAWECCVCWSRGLEVDASAAPDVAVFEGEVVAMCSECRRSRGGA
jgi:hypothetical protein